MKLLLLSVLLMSLVGCISSPIVVMDTSEIKTFDEPLNGQGGKVLLGETIARFGEATTKPALEITETTQFNKAEGEQSIMTCAVTVNSGTYFMRGEWQSQSTTAECFGPAPYQITLADGTTNWNCLGQSGTGDVCLEDNGNYFFGFLASTADLKQDFDNVRRVEKIVPFSDSLLQELSFSGVSQGNIMFTYREFRESLDRPDFVQDLIFDRSLGDEFSFKGLTIKIIEANSNELDFELISNFSPSDL